MKRAGPCFLCAVAVFALSARAETSDRAEKLVRSNDRFAFQLYSELSRKDGNLLVSPFSLSVVLTMTSAGAAGATLEEMRKTLSLTQGASTVHEAFRELASRIGDSAKASDAELHIRNALWIREKYPVDPAFSGLLKKTYGAPLHTADFEDAPTRAAAAINAWVAEGTRDRVARFIEADDLSEYTAAILLNTVYFHGRWESTFQHGSTRQEPFFVGPRQSVQVPTMHQTRIFRMVRKDGVAVLELPYRKRGFSMFLFLPEAREGLSAMEKKLTVDRVNEWLGALHPSEVEVSLPRFVFQCDYRLKDTLSRMGMPRAFDWRHADFSRMVSKGDADAPPRSPWIRTVVQRAGIQVDEEGTVAWAASRVEMIDAIPVEFRADHPFCFLITENSTGTVLFLGRVANPGGA